MKALLLAGGYATRLWPLTEAIAKPLLIIGEKPLLSHIVDAIPSDIPIIVSTNTDFADDFKVWQKEYHQNRKITVFVEPSNHDKQLGALGAISYAIKEFGEDDYLISAGDNIYPFQITDFIAKFNKTILVAAYDIESLDKAKKFGVITIDNKTKRAIEFQEKPLNPNSTLVSTALYIIPKNQLNFLHQSAEKSAENIGSLLENAISKKIPIDVYTFLGKWYDIGSFDTYIEVHQEFSTSKAKLDKSNMLQGSIFIDPSSKVSKSYIENSIILAGCRIENVSLKKVIVGRNCILENIDLEYKSIRDNTRLIN